MKIIEGFFAGTQIKYQEQKGTRVTTDKVRKAVFDVLKGLVDPSAPLGTGFEGLKVADLFCGSGMYGIESMSRGAKEILFLDDDKRVVKTLRQNIKKILKNIRDIRYWILDINYDKFIKINTERFDLVFADPPYYDFDFTKFNDIYKILNKNGIFVLESSKRVEVGELKNLKLVSKKIYGDTRVGFYRKNI